MRIARKGLRASGSGYSAERDFAGTKGRIVMQSRISLPRVSSTDLRALGPGGSVRQRAVLSPDRPRDSWIRGAGATRHEVTLDWRGLVRDEQGRTGGRIKDTLEITAASARTLDGKQVLFRGVTLPSDGSP